MGRGDLNVQLEACTIKLESVKITKTTNFRLELSIDTTASFSCTSDEGESFLRGYLEHATLTIDELCDGAIGYMLTPDGRDRTHNRGLRMTLFTYFCSAFPWHKPSDRLLQTPAFIKFVEQVFLRLPKKVQGWDAYWTL